MRSSGLIYAVIVGAWAAYLVPMWLRRQDELNEARPTERFSTAIRLLSGRAAMQRRYDKAHGEFPADDAGDDVDPDAPADEAAARAFGDPASADQAEAPHTRVQSAPPRPSAAERTKRAKVLARRRRTTTILFLTFTAGAIVAAVGGLPFLWAPALPALLLTAYIIYLRAQERRRFTFTMDRRKAEAAAQRLREGRRHRPQQAADQPPADDHPADVRTDPRPPPPRNRPAPRPPPTPRAAAPWSRRPTTPSGSTSSANANARAPRAAAGTRSRSRSPPTSPPRSPPARPAMSTWTPRTPGAPPAPAPSPTTPSPAPPPRTAPPTPAAAPAAAPPLRPVRGRGPPARGE